MQWNEIKGTDIEHCKGNSVYIFLFWELRGLSPNFYIHVSVSNLYISRIGPHISSSRNGSSIVGIYNSLTDTWMWKLGPTEAPIFLFWEYLLPIFGIFSLQWRDLGKCRNIKRKKERKKEGKKERKRERATIFIFNCKLLHFLINFPLTLSAWCKYLRTAAGPKYL